MDKRDRSRRGVGLGRPFRLLAVLARQSWRRMQVHNAMAVSASLSFRTIFALIPTIVLIFLVLKGAGAIAEPREGLARALEAAGLSQIEVLVADDGPVTRPTTGPEAVENLAERIESLVAHVERQMTFARVGPVGLLLLGWAVITLLTTMEQALNRAFGARRSRPLATRALLYWSVVTFVPLVLAALGYVAESAMESVRDVPVLGTLVAGGRTFGSLLVGALLLAAVYRFLPNTPVRYRWALLGAAITVPVLLAARWGFGLYVSKLVARGSIYGALGLLPLFLIWVNLCWYAFLFGAEVAFTSANLPRLRSGHKAVEDLPGPMDALAVALAVAEAFERGEGPLSLDQIARRVGLGSEDARQLIDVLEAGRIICLVSPAGRRGREGYVPARPPESIHAGEVLHMGQSGARGDVGEAMDEVRRRIDTALGETTLSQLLADRKH